MAYSTQQIINGAFRKLGIGAAGETLPAQDSNDAKFALNLMLNSWSARGISTLVTVSEEFTLTPNVGVYTIGPDADFDTIRPMSIAHASIKYVGTDYLRPLRITQEVQFELFSDRLVNLATPDRVFYEPTMPAGTLRVYQIPDAAYPLLLRSRKPLAEMVLLSDEFEVEPTYLEAIMYNLAVRLAPDYGVALPPEVAEMAFSLFEVLTRRVLPDLFMSCDDISRPSRFNINVIE